MKKQNLPKAKFASDPFVSGFTDIEYENANLIIGESKKTDNIFSCEYPEYIRMLCSITYKTEFPNTAITARYKVTHDGDLKTMSYNLYDNSRINMNGFVSEVVIEFNELQPNSDFVKKSWQEFLTANKILYRKKFGLQLSSRNIENFIDDSSEQSGIIHTKSKAHLFAGSYFKGIKFSDIQQYLFFVGTGRGATEYISIIPAKDVLQTGKVKLDSSIPVISLATLEDDICNGNLEITFDMDTKYRSILAEKSTLTSDIFQILFKREGDNG
ncbi:MAG: hypothetical protein LBB34_00080 [Holosporales bacterium]|jgi:hypothetical protein|nr:hypothetical protein [Holosporales bacterium]